MAVDNYQNDATSLLVNRLKSIDGIGRMRSSSLDDAAAVVGAGAKFESDAIVCHASECAVPEVGAECADELTMANLIVHEIVEEIFLSLFPSCTPSESAADDVWLSAPRTQRSSSLRTSKPTPSPEPARKKIVRFADALGLDLADVRTYLDDGAPSVPLSAYRDLIIVDDLCSLKFPLPPPPSSSSQATTLIALFQQPIHGALLLNRVTLNGVALETASVDHNASSLCVRGRIRVRNLAYDKTVHVRFTTDGWKTSTDVEADYIEPSNQVDNNDDGYTDRFAFALHTLQPLAVGERLEFAVRFACNGRQFWDNNNDRNYCFQCVTSVPPAPPPNIDDQFATFYYSDKHTEDQHRLQELEQQLEAVDVLAPPLLVTAIESPPVLNSAQVQEYITRSLNKHNSEMHLEKCSDSSIQMQVFFVILLVSILGLYIKKMLLS